MGFFSKIFRRNKAKNAPLITEPPLPEFEEVFEVEEVIYNQDPLKTPSAHLDPLSPPTADFVDQSDLKTLILTLMVGLDEHLALMVEKPTNHHKAMQAVGIYLRDGQLVPIAYVQWNQSPIQGLAARMIVKGKSRTVLFGPALAMVRNIAPYGPDFTALIEAAHEKGNIVYLLAIDGLAYAVFEVSHRIQEVRKIF
jgi:hypothetical protein